MAELEPKLAELHKKLEHHILEQKSNYSVSSVTQWFDGEVSLVDYQPALDPPEEEYTVSQLTFSASVFEATT